MNISFQIRVTCILVRQNKILIVKQKLSEKRSWSLPGGRLEHGESLEDAAVRELYEETGITAKVERLLYICDTKPINKVIHITFLMKYIKGNIRLPDNTREENPITDVLFANIDHLTNYGFSEKFVCLVQEGFPGQGSYMGDKSNIGLEI